MATTRGNNAFFCDLEATDADFMRHLTTPAILQVAMEALGPDVDLFGSQFAYKQARGGSQFAWHQDSGYGHIAPAEYLTLWLALDDATVENGTIWVMLGSHKSGRLTHRRSETNANDMIGYPADANYQGVPVEVEAGRAALFSSLTLHKSGPNTTDQARRARVMQFCRPGTHSTRAGHLYSKLALCRQGERVTQEFLPYQEAAEQAWGAYPTIEGADRAAEAIAADARALLES